MATFIDAAVVGYFSSLFVFLLVLVVTYAILSMTEILGQNKSLSAIVAFALAILFAASGTATRIFEIAAPWFVLIFLILFLLILIFKFTGSEELIGLKKNVAIIVILIVVVVAIFVLSAGEVNREKKAALVEAGEITEESEVLSFAGKVGETLRHPAILGLIVLLLMAVFTIMLLGAGPPKP